MGLAPPRHCGTVLMRVDPHLGSSVGLLSVPTRSISTWLSACPPQGWIWEAPQHSHLRGDRQGCRQRCDTGRERRQEPGTCGHSQRDPGPPGAAVGDSPATVCAVSAPAPASGPARHPGRRSLCRPGDRAPTAALGGSKHLRTGRFLLSLVTLVLFGADVAPSPPPRSPVVPHSSRRWGSPGSPALPHGPGH